MYENVKQKKCLKSWQRVHFENKWSISCGTQQKVGKIHNIEMPKIENQSSEHIPKVSTTEMKKKTDRQDKTN